VPEPADLYVEPGDLWALGRHRLLCGDATDPAAVARLVGGDSVDLLWSDPPYSVAYTGKTAAALTIANDDPGIEGTRELVAAALRLVPLRAGGTFYLTSPAGPAHLAFLLALGDACLAVHQTLIWVKDRFVLGHSDYHYRHEPILYGWREGSHVFRGDRRQDSVWEIARPARNDVHPTIKPVELVERAIRNSCAPGDTVSDPFVGSGTTIIAAERTERRCLAMEIDPRYAQVAIERWQTLSGARATRVSRLGDRETSDLAQDGAARAAEGRP
jgi:site-specific DNA-methyltransferase (adenine-specific)